MNRLSLAVLTALTTLLLATPAVAVLAPEQRPLPNIDVRPADGGPTTAAQRRARAALERSLGDEGIVSSDRVTGAARLVARTDGFLTGRRSAAPTAVALDYVRGRPDVFGLDSRDLGRLALTRRDRSFDGVTHLTYTQTFLGVASYDNVLLANVADDGRLLNVGGAAVSDLAVPSVTPDLTAAAALAAARRDVDGALIAPRSQQGSGAERPTRFSNGDTARLTLFNDGTTTRLAWRLEVAGENEVVYELVIDATSGRVLKRRSLTEFAAAQVYRNHPGAASGGTPEPVDLAADPTWLNQSAGSTKLSGNNAHAYVDADATDVNPAPSGAVFPDLEVPASAGSNWNYLIVPFPLPGCPPGPEQCTWDVSDPASRTTNRNQATTQLFYFVNTFHDHLAQPPIGFTPATGNFELAGAPGVGGDPVIAETDNFLNPSESSPTSTNNASMTTRADGTPPRLEMFLFTNPSVNAADTADVVYHEYTHGLTNRSVGSGVGLDANQSRAMGEGWSDWYALDFLAADGLVTDNAPVDGELNLGGYLGNVFGTGGFRRQGIDCPVGSTAAACPGKPGTHTGGYTLGDLGSVGSGFEVHDDGEIWAETLWDLRRTLGVFDSRRLITAGLRLSPNNPSFLEARDAILLADRLAGGQNYATLWPVFAARGMGFSARTTSSAATTADARFDTPPALVHESTTISDVTGGDGDDVPEPGETIRVSERLRNPAPASVTGISGTLSASTPDVTVGAPVESWPMIAARGTAINTAPFQITVAPGAACDTDAQLSLAMTTNQDIGSFTIPLRVPVGSKPSSDVPKVIPTPASGVSSTLTFAGNGPIDDLEVRIPRLAHTWVGDLVVTLKSPAGTTVTLMDRPGAGAEGASGDDFVNLVFDDDAATPIDSIPAAAPPGGYSGRFRPTQPLAAFDGPADRQGTWTLTVKDAFPADDSGTLYDWGIRPSSANCPNRAPLAVDDSHAVAGNQALQGASVLANDSDPDGNALVAEKATEAAHGTVALAAGGTFTYTPDPGFRGDDAFTYRARDNGPGQLTALATVRISVGNRGPTAADDAYAVAAGVTLNGSSVLANDSDPNGDALTAALESPPAHGTLTLAPNGTFVYTPVPGFSGRDAFVYRAADDSLSSAPATVTITVATGAAVAPPPPPPPPARAPARAPAKLEVLRAGVSAGRLDVLASITTLATGSVRVSYLSVGRTASFDAAISRGRISFRRLLPRAQRTKPTGIFTLSYAGSSAVQADSVRLRAARGKARLVRTTSLIDKSGRLRVSGTITRRARGVVRVRLGYIVSGGSTEFLNYTTKIGRGRWSLVATLPTAAARAGGQLSIQYTGYEPSRIRGEQLARAVRPAG